MEDSNEVLMEYIPLSQKYYTPLSQKPNNLLKPESKKYKCFLNAIGKNAISIDSGYDVLYNEKEDICAIYLFKMLLDTTIKSYGILLAENPEKYLYDYLKGNPYGDYVSRCQNKYDGKSLTDGNILEYMEKDYPHITDYFNDASRYIYTSNLFFSSIGLGKEFEEWLWDSREDGLDDSICILSQWKDREWVYEVMGIINEVVLDVMDKVVEMVEPPIVLPHLDTDQILNPKNEEE